MLTILPNLIQATYSNNSFESHLERDPMKLLVWEEACINTRALYKSISGLLCNEKNVTPTRPPRLSQTAS